MNAWGWAGAVILWPVVAVLAVLIFALLCVIGPPLALVYVLTD